MDNRHKSDIKNWPHKGIQASERSDAIKDFQSTAQGCNCNYVQKDNGLDDMDCRRNRVTIVGRLGLTDNDQYILNCAATVDDKPIELRQERQRAGPNYFTPNSKLQLYNQQCRKISQATQANLNICSDAINIEISNDKTVQCKCANTNDASTTISQCEIGESKVPKSPLIVITIYSNKDSTDNAKSFHDLVQVKQQPILPTNTSGLTKMAKDRVDYSTVNRNMDRNLRSRSPSPPVKIAAKTKSQNRINDQKLVKTVKKESPDRQALSRQVKPQKDTIQKQTKLSTVQAAKAKTAPVKKEQRVVKVPNTEQVKFKKALIDSYVQNFNISANYSDATVCLETKAKNEPSKITINIDSDKEHYDVLLLQNKLNTDLAIRKTAKENKTKPTGGKHDYEDNASEDSMDNFLMLSKETNPRSHFVYQNHTAMDKRLQNRGRSHRSPSGLKVRDSLEINHSREQSRCINDIKTSNEINKKQNKSHANKTNHFAPVKHYRGDKCSVPNPAERDKEIRGLLGIETTRSGKLAFNQRTLPIQFINQELQPSLYETKCEECNSFITQQCNSSWNKHDLNNVIKTPNMVSTFTQYEHVAVQQMVLNRNVQVFLQVEQFTKQKPIILSRNQYDKVKKTIEKTVSKKFCQEKRKLCTSKNSVISIGEIRKTRKQRISNLKFNRTVQAKDACMQAEQVGVCFQNQETQRTERLGERCPLVLLNGAEKDAIGKNNFKASPRQTVSSLEIRRASIAHMKHVTFSSSNLGSCNPGEVLCNLKERCPSIQTIFKGHKKSATPNLGTSAYSLYTDAGTERVDSKYVLRPVNEKPRKPFLRRLMSCLVMRSARVSEVKLPPQPLREPPSQMSSFDSYHISTSLGAMELTSSLYDTSASFYTNHTILPINKMKRGFFTSVRGFLTNRKSR